MSLRDLNSHHCVRQLLSVCGVHCVLCSYVCVPALPVACVPAAPVLFWVKHSIYYFKTNIFKMPTDAFVALTFAKTTQKINGYF